MALKWIFNTLLASGGSFRIGVDDTEVTLKFNKFAQRLTDFRRFWVEYFAPQFFKDIQENFARSGALVGGWRALSPEYASWKLSKYGVRPILVLTGAMRESLRLGGRGNILRATKTRGTFGSSDRKVRFHQEGTRRMPRRQVIFITRGTVYQRLLNTYAREQLAWSGIRAR